MQSMYKMITTTPVMKRLVRDYDNTSNTNYNIMPTASINAFDEIRINAMVNDNDYEINYDDYE